MSLIPRVADTFALGMNDSASASEDFQRGECSLMRNVRPDWDGAAAPRGGSFYLTTTAIAAPGGYAQLFSFSPSAGLGGGTQMVAAVGASIYYSTDAGQTWSGTGAGVLTPGVWSSCTVSQGGVNYLILVNGAHALYWTGAAIGTISAWPSGVRYVVESGKRVWFSGHDGNQVGATKINDFQVDAAPDGLLLQVGGSDPVTGLAAFRGSVLAFKKHETARIDGLGESTLVVAAGSVGQSQSVGCVANQTIQSVGDRGICFQSERGIEIFDGAQIQQIGDGVRTFVSRFDRETAATISRAFYYPERDEYWLFAPQRSDGTVLSSPEQDGAYGCAVNLRTGASWLVDYGADSHLTLMPLCFETFVVTASIGLAVDTRARPITITAEGKPLALEYFAANANDFMSPGIEDGTAITTSLEGPAWDWDMPYTRKWGRRIRIWGRATHSTNSVKASAIADGDETASFTLALETADRPRATLPVGVSARGIGLQVRLFDFTNVHSVSGFSLEAKPQPTVRG